MEVSEEKYDAWHIMSNLYLDQELDTSSIMVLAEKLALTMFPIEELEDIFYKEVHPVCCFNLQVPAGEWISFDKQQLQKNILKSLATKEPKGWIKKARFRQESKSIEKLKGIVKMDWEKAKMLIELIRKGRINIYDRENT